MQRCARLLLAGGMATAVLVAVFAHGTGLMAQSTPVGSVLSNPHPYGVEFEAGVFDMKITAVDLDAWPEILAVNQFNDPPAEGRRYVMWTLAIENARGSADNSQRAYDSDFSAVVSGVVFEVFSFDHYCGLHPNELNHDLFLGGKVEANICLSLPVEDPDVTLNYEVDHTDASGNDIDSDVWFRGLDDSGGTDLPAEPEFHPCDTNQDGRIDGAEVLEVIALYFAGLQ